MPLSLKLLFEGIHQAMKMACDHSLRPKLVTPPKTWAIICPRPDHWHVMAGPIIN